MSHFHEVRGLCPRKHSEIARFSLRLMIKKGYFAYFTSVTRNSTSTDKPEADGSLILRLSLH